MSFFKTLRNIAQGKPPFDPTDNTPHSQPMPGQPQPMQSHNSHGVSPQQTWNGPKHIPIAMIEERDVDIHENGRHLDISAVIFNESNQEVDLDKVRIFGINRELDTRLRPGEKRQFNLYSGNRPQNTSQPMCELWYKDMSGDYFSSQHNMEFRKNPDGTISIVRIRYQRIKDI